MKSYQHAVPAHPARQPKPHAWWDKERKKKKENCSRDVLKKNRLYWELTSLKNIEGRVFFLNLNLSNLLNVARARFFGVLSRENPYGQRCERRVAEGNTDRGINQSGRRKKSQIRVVIIYPTMQGEYAKGIVGYICKQKTQLFEKILRLLKYESRNGYQFTSSYSSVSFFGIRIPATFWAFHLFSQLHRFLGLGLIGVFHFIHAIVFRLGIFLCARKVRQDCLPDTRMFLKYPTNGSSSHLS